MFVKPASDLIKTRDPFKKDLLPAEGREVPDNQYWHRRLADGDVVEAEAPKEIANAVRGKGAPKDDAGASSTAN